MKVIALVLLAGLASAGSAAEGRKASKVVRSVYNIADGSHVECVQDLDLREQTEITFNTQGIKTARKVYLLNQQGLPTNGNIYDGKDQLKARAQFLFDSFDRLSEQRMFNLQGEVFQRIVFNYDSKGRQLPPKSVTYNVKAPDMKSAPIDFTHPRQQAPHYDRSQGELFTPGQGNVPMLPDGAMGKGSGATGGTTIPETTNQTQEAVKKEGFFKRLFKKSSDDKK